MRQVIARSPLPGTPEQVFALITDGARLAEWFCDACDSDARLGGEVHAAWTDEEGESWDRVGVWSEFDAPYRVTLQWLAVQTADQPDQTSTVDELKFAVAPHPRGCMLTVISPLPNVDTPVRPEVLEDAAQQGWQQCFQLLEQILNAANR